MLQNIFTPRVRQAFAASSAGLLLGGMMTSWGFPAAALPQIEQPDSQINLTPQQASWFATVPFMMCIPGSLVGGAIYEWGGPRKFMLILTPLLCISCMIMTVASWQVVLNAGAAEILLLTSRVIQGALVAILNPFISLYTYEISGQQLRGMFLGVMEIWATLGFLLNYITGCFLPWYTIAWVLPLVTLFPAFVGMCLSPESPLWMARKGREEEARAILEIVRSSKEEVQADLKTVQMSLQENEQTCMESLQTISKKSNIMAILASCLPLVMKELGGFAVISIYIVYIFDQAGVGMDPKWSSVVVGFARMICNAFAALLLLKWSRKRILIIGNTLTGIACVAIGVFFFLQEKGEDISKITWLPLVGLVVHMIAYAGSVGPCTWTVAVEVLPGPIRALGFGIGSTAYAIASFVVSKTFIDLKDLVGLHGVFWLFAGGSICYILLVLTYIPETKGRSMKDIEDYWEDSRKMLKGVKV